MLNSFVRDWPTFDYKFFTPVYRSPEHRDYEVEENDQGYLISIEVPGISAEDLTIEVKNNHLQVKGQRPNRRTTQKESRYASFERSFTLPEGVNGSEILAECSNGLLEVHVPKPAQAKTVKIPISVQADSSRKRVEKVMDSAQSHA